MNIPSIEQYQEIIEKHLSTKQREALKTLYSFPNASATAKELAKALNYKSFSPANKMVSNIGKVIYKRTGIVPPIPYYIKNKKQPGYFSLVGEYFEDTGWNMWDNMQKALENLNRVSKDINHSVERLPTEIQSDKNKKLYEGKVIQVFVNRYERNKKAKDACKRHHGDKCLVCGFDFGKTYGDIAKGFILVHHLIQLSEIKQEYEVDPDTDLVPVCANCHSVIHMKNPPMTIEEIQDIIKKVS